MSGYEISQTLPFPVGYGYGTEVCPVTRECTYGSPILEVIIDQMKYDTQYKDDKDLQDSHSLWLAVKEAFDNDEISLDDSFVFPSE